MLIVALSALGVHAQTREPEPSLPYTIRSQDTLIKPSRDMLTTPQAWSQVAKFNQLADADVLVPGQKIDVPLRLLKSKAAASKVIIAEGEWPMTALAGAQAYRVEVASDEKVDQIVCDVKFSGGLNGATGASAEPGTLANGNWFARVRGIDPAGLEGFDAAKVERRPKAKHSCSL